MPLVVVTVTGTEPQPACGGVTTRTRSGESRVTFEGASAVPANDTLVSPGTKSVPVMVTVVPPRIGPMNGATVEMVGAASVSRAIAVPQ